MKLTARMDSVTDPFARERRSYIMLLRDPGTAARRKWKDYYDGLKRDWGGINR
ncbi:MAG TPA: hypothetical protein VGR89_07900 [Puia sp.]|nr:hypothetical protein [Puia sp.]